MDQSFILDFSEALEVNKGDGDGFKEITPKRCPVPSCRKFNARTKSKKEVISRLEHAISEMKTKKGTPNKSKFHKSESISVDTPCTVSQRKRERNIEQNIEIYATPRKMNPRKQIPKAAAQVVLKYLLLNSWRKSRSRCQHFVRHTNNLEEKINQLNIQINVLKNLGRSESSKRQDISSRYQELQKQLDTLVNENISLKDQIENITNDCSGTKNDLSKLNEQLELCKDVIQAKDNALRVLQEKYEREKEKARRQTVDKKITTERVMKLENTINIQKESLENLKLYMENLQASKRTLASTLSKSEQTGKNYADKIHSQTLLIETYKFKLSEYEKENSEMEQKIKNLQLHLDIVNNEYSDLKTKNESFEQDIFNLSQKLEEEREYTPWNLMKKGMISTYSALKYLANLMVPAIQSNYLKC
ncbi:hypothetical protein HHI36_011848 [Cryptolaemus montrouzieri]|uniref:Uncharacterized protein n=1 Tax=Cryptolaemus montrouzieri TaxID=559131 RepID=A0ABD2NCW3_9CUCU